MNNKSSELLIYLFALALFLFIIVIMNFDNIFQLFEDGSFIFLNKISGCLPCSPCQ